MFTILKNCCCVYFCPWLYDDTNSDSDGDVSDTSTVDTRMPYHRFKDQPIIYNDNPLYSNEKITRN
tara:strand:+ start:133 stop:330 length:198 start_codon:yes stop_codon:yes gene_type:complete